MTTPRRRIRINPGLYKMRTREFAGQLTRIKNWLVNGRITLAHAKILAKRLFDEELQRLIAVTRDEMKFHMKPKPIPQDEMDRMEKWKEEELTRYNAVLDDAAAL